MDEAITYYNKAILIDKEDSSLLYKRATAYLLKGKNNNALQDLNIVLEKKPDLVQARIRRGKIYVGLGKFDAANSDFQQVLQLKPDNEIALKQIEIIKISEIHWKEATEYFDKGEYNKAIEKYNTYIELIQDSIQARYQRALCYFKNKEFNLVIDDTMRILKSQNDNLDALYLRGTAFLYLGQLEAAINHLREALKFDPDNSKCKSEFKRIKKLERTMKDAESNMQNKLYKEAINDLLLAIQLENDNTYFHNKLYTQLCESYVNTKQSQLAIDSCTKALNLESNIEAHIWRGEAYLILEQYDNALRDFQQANQQDQTNQRAREGYHKAQRLQKMASRKNYYKILGVSKEASHSEIKKAFRKLGKI